MTTDSRPCDQSLDEKLSCLKWLPWVGSEYLSLPVAERTLVLGESHYLNGKASNQDGQLYTREVVQESLVNDEWRTSTLSGIAKMLESSGREHRSKLWSRLVYHNLVLRTVGSVAERPRADDFIRGWEAMKTVIGVLQPSTIVSIGVGSAWHLRDSRVFGAIDLRYDKPINRVSPRITILRHAGRDIQTVFIRHSSRYFTASDWRAYLLNNHPQLRSALTLP